MSPIFVSCLLILSSVSYALAEPPKDVILTVIF